MHFSQPYDTSTDGATRLRFPLPTQLSELFHVLNPRVEGAFKLSITPVRSDKFAQIMIQSEGAPSIHCQCGGRRRSTTVDTRWPSKLRSVTHHRGVQVAGRPAAVAAGGIGRPSVDNDDINCRKFVYGLIVARKAASSSLVVRWLDCCCGRSCVNPRNQYRAPCRLTSQLDETTSVPTGERNLWDVLETN